MKTTSEIRLENLRLLVNEAGGVTELSKIAGYKQPSYIYQILNRTVVQNGKAKNIGSIMASKLEIVMGKPKGWMDQEHTEAPKSNAVLLGAIDPWDISTPLRDDEVEVPLFKDVCLAVNNDFADDTKGKQEKLRFAKSTLNKLDIKPEYVVCVMADGTSMAPVIPDGTIIGINKEDKTIRDGKIYAVNHGGLLRIKILKKRPDNRVLMQSYNFTEYADEEVNMEDMHIIGRVFWWSVIA